MLYGVVGSDTNLHYSVVPRGGYMTMMVCGLAVLWMACRISARGRDGDRISLWLYFAMGVLAGLGRVAEILGTPGAAARAADIVQAELERP